MAAHPSMQRKTTGELRARYYALERQRAAAASFEPSAELQALFAAITTQRQAILLALEWRGCAL